MLIGSVSQKPCYLSHHGQIDKFWDATGAVARSNLTTPVDASWFAIVTGYPDPRELVGEKQGGLAGGHGGVVWRQRERGVRGVHLNA